MIKDDDSWLPPKLLLIRPGDIPYVSLEYLAVVAATREISVENLVEELLTEISIELAGGERPTEH